MNEMIERTARALCDWQEPGRYDALANQSPDSSSPHQEHYRIMVRAVILAMLEPTGEMIVAGVEAAVPDNTGRLPRQAKTMLPFVQFKARYNAAIGAALSSPDDLGDEFEGMTAALRQTSPERDE